MELSNNKREDGIPVALEGGGEMGEKIRHLDWGQTSLGSIGKWPKTLHTALGICINSNFPIAIYWGEDLVLIYNDPWSPIPGTKHPWALGKPAREVWPEIWTDIEPQFQKAFSGIPGGSKDALLPMQRHGYTEECYFDFTFTPIYGETGKVEGVFNAVIETTYRYINERRSFVLQRLSNSINSIIRTSQVIENAGEVLEVSKIDIPFYCIYTLSDNKHLEIQKQSPEISDLSAQLSVEQILDGNPMFFSDLPSMGVEIIPSHWPEQVTEAIVLPFKGNDTKVFGCIVLGVSPRRKYDKEYESFFESIVNLINGELNTIQALDLERKRSEALAEIDRSKTIFFSNISHEFRTPLTLMLSPLEAVLENGKNLTEEQQGNIETSYRNTLRLQRLVNTLLDFSSLEAGRIEAHYEKVNIGKLTGDLASSFRSAIESGGLTFDVRVEKVDGDVFIDVQMWEKIVLNLISNAFKYTRQGRIEVIVRQVDDHVVFSVADTGSGISEEDQVKIFERFYRVKNADGRSQEGTGIGLAMIKELIHLQEGKIFVESKLGEGSCFTVEIPKGKKQHMNEGSIFSDSQRNKSKVQASFLEEAQSWVVGDPHGGGGEPDTDARQHDAASFSKVLVVDDNSDMRTYLNRLLKNNFRVETAVDGEEGYALAIEWKPDLIISDIMMPKLDGFGLLKKLKNNLVTRNTPVIFLSARAGEEARVGGIEAGADDYLTKPFSAKELLARVSNHIAISNARRKTEKEFFNLFLQSPAHIHVMKGPEHVFEFFHPLGIPFVGRDLTGMKVRDALPEIEGQGYLEMLDKVYNDGTPIYLKESKAVLSDIHGQPTEYYFNITYLPWKDLHGKIQGILQFSLEVTEMVKGRLKAEASERNFRSIAEQAPVAICVLNGPDHIIQLVNEPVLEIWGRKHDEVIDLPVAQALPEVVEQGIIAILDGVYKTGKPFLASERPLELLRKGRLEKIYLNFIYEPFLNPEKEIAGIIAVAVDVSEQVNSRKIIEEAQYSLNNAVELAELGTWNVTIRTKRSQYSPRVAEWWGLPEDGCNLQEVLGCVHPDDLDHVSAAIDNAMKGLSQYKTEYRVINRTTKQQRYIEAIGKVFFDENNEPVKLSGIVRDVTFFKAAQQELEKQVDLRTVELVDLNKALSKSNENLSQFAYVASHDLQEPLRKIQTFSEMIKNNLSNRDYLTKYLTKIDNSAARMSALIKDVLLYSRITSDEHSEEVDLNNVLENVRSDFELSIEQKGAVIKAGRLPVIKANKLHFHQLFSNLIGNSLKFSKDSPVIEIGWHLSKGEEIPEHLKNFDKYYCLQFSDNGIGIEPEYTEKIFGLFTRLHSRNDFGGTGIGLALCKKIVDSYGGYISATSKKGSGALFSVFIPVNVITD